MRDIDELFESLSRSRFRSRFRLSGKDARYLEEKGIGVILGHGCDFVRERLGEAEPANDGKQTPMKNHPVFVAQHATATCCRGCLAKWHKIPKGRPLTQKQIDHILTVIERWLRSQDVRPGTDHRDIGSVGDGIIS